jgi:penicillin-binding protein 1A
MKRKLQELILAIKLEANFSKYEILTIYLNRIYFGAGTFGIDAASRRYFQKPAKEMNLFEAAILAGILKAPSRYSPSSNPKRALDRARIVLSSMEASGFITDKWKVYFEDWSKEFLGRSGRKENGCRYFADWVFETIPELIGAISEDLTVVTTLHPEMQKQTELICKKFYDEFKDEYKFNEVSSVVMSPTGEVFVMVGGLDYGKSQFNRATAALRQPGSAFKTFVFLAALENGIDKDEKFEDSPYEQGTWKPGNYMWKELGEISLFEAYVYSVNSVCIRIAKKVGIRNVIKTARRLGITSPLNNDLTLSIGSPDLTLMEMLRAYAPFINGGYLCVPYGIVEIRNKNGDILYQHKTKKLRVIEDEQLCSMREMMRAVIVRGTGRAANKSENAIGKTGSNSNRDAWFFGGLLPERRNGNTETVDQEEPATDILSAINRLDPNLFILKSKDEAEDDSTISADEKQSTKAIADNGLVMAVWIGNDMSDNKMAPISTGGRIPTRIAGAILEKFINNPEPGGQNFNKKSKIAASVNQLLGKE